MKRLKLEQVLDLSLYGTGEAKHWNSLVQEIESRECLILWEDNRPIRLQQIVVVDVRSPEGIELVESSYEFSDGRVIGLTRPGLLSNVKRGESVSDAACRAIKENLGIDLKSQQWDVLLDARCSVRPSREIIFRIKSIELEEITSSLYPGLPCRYHKFYFLCQLPKKLHQK